MAKSARMLNDEIRARYMKPIFDFLTERGEEVLRTGTNEFGIPCVDSENNEKFILISFKVPTGSRDGDAYDGYSMAEDYALKQKNKAEEAEKRAKEKERKIARDKAQREAKAKAKAEAKAREEAKGQ